MIVSSSTAGFGATSGVTRLGVVDGDVDCACSAEVNNVAPARRRTVICHEHGLVREVIVCTKRSRGYTAGKWTAGQ